MARPGLTLDKVVDAALELVREGGESALSLSALARYFKVKSPSLYNHVNGIDDLKRAMRLRGLHALQRQLQEAVMGRSGRDALWAAGHAYRDFARSQPALYGMTLKSTEPEDPELREAGQQVLAVILAILRAYDLDGDAALHATRCLRSSLHGFVSLEIGQGFAMDLDLDQSFERLLITLDQSFRSGVMKT